MEELKRALKALYLEVESSIVDDVSKKVMNVIEKLQEKNKELEKKNQQLKGSLYDIQDIIVESEIDLDDRND